MWIGPSVVGTILDGIPSHTLDVPNPKEKALPQPIEAAHFWMFLPKSAKICVLCPRLVFTSSPCEAYISNILFRNTKVKEGGFFHFPFFCLDFKNLSPTLQVNNIVEEKEQNMQAPVMSSSNIVQAVQ